MILSMLAAGAVLMAGAPAAAAPADPPAAQAAPGERAKPICHMEERPGSHMSERICLTATQAAERQQESKEAVDSVRRRGSGERTNPAGAVPR
ncbi:MAG TPA: hypothetical protein VLI41_04360 [Phenylobacterium sp.]|uniref:hypothetical protein n=1 Tax=Phenylobacterium sp. TaxID=1871053 RepID=UPI002BC6EF1E|nr:hypothetical protein [Phenylobacterium sp.]HSV02417.1 hypothetical protein [Phenylobacterium sp.]